MESFHSSAPKSGRSQARYTRLLTTRRDHIRDGTSDGRGRRALLGGASLGLSLLAGCGSLPPEESVLNPGGPQAHRITILMWIFIVVCIIVYVLVMLALLGAFLHRRRGQAAAHTGDAPITQPDPQRENRLWTVVWGAIAVTVLTLFVLMIGDFIAGRGIHSLSKDPDPLRIKVIAHQWWWEVQYADWPERFGERFPSNRVTTANEIHIPVDPSHPVTVQFDLSSTDVIHSFWVPSLHGKKDVIPGHPTSIWLRADKPDLYWGECGEYCGYQHAQMRLLVVAEPVEQFQTWLEGARQTPPDPTDPVQARGRQVFLQGTCAMCHAIQGTEARAHVGPDLTHVAGRKILAAGAVSNTRGDLAGWIVDPQRIKPGVRMPQNNLKPEDLRSLLEYLETLK